jgi:acetyltransferase
MSIRNLEHLFRPASVALVGASRRPQSVGAVVAHNLFAGGFDGPVMPVNPHEQSIASALAYASVADLPLAPDLAVICTPPETVPDLIKELGTRGTKAAVILSAGFGEGGPSGQHLQQRVLNAAQPHLLRLVGPNCLGIMVPRIGLNAGFAHLAPRPGDLAFVGQSGAIVTSVLDWATARGIGFSHLVSLGDMVDVDLGDMLDWLTADAGTQAILLYVEAVTQPRKFMSAARPPHAPSPSWSSRPGAARKVPAPPHRTPGRWPASTQSTMRLSDAPACSASSSSTSSSTPSPHSPRGLRSPATGWLC